jgi:hypothetical protein
VGGGDGETYSALETACRRIRGRGTWYNRRKTTGVPIKNQTGAEQQVAPGRSDRPMEVLQNSFCSLQLNQENKILNQYISPK